MTSEALAYISDLMESANIPYEFMEFTKQIDSLESYWVGSYSEIAPLNEDGMQETQFILTGTGKTSWMHLEAEKAKIEKLFPTIGGRQVILENGSGIAIFYDNAFPIPTGNAFLKRIQINLTIKEWKVDE